MEKVPVREHPAHSSGITGSEAAATLRPPPPLAPKPGVVHVFNALYDYESQQEDELSFVEGDRLYVKEEDITTASDWLKAKCGNKTGLIPTNYIDLSTKQQQTTNQILHDACRRGNTTLLQELLQNHISVASVDTVGNTGLHWSARNGHLDCCQLLVNNIQAKSSSSSTMLTTLINTQNKLGETPLHLATVHGQVHIVQYLLEFSYIDIFVKNMNGECASDLANDLYIKNLLRCYEQKKKKKDDEGCELGDGSSEYLGEDEDDGD